MAVGIDNLELLERSVYQVKSMLKERDFSKFDEAKAKAIEKLNRELQSVVIGPPTYEFVA